MSAASLSISSSTNTGFIEPAFLSPATIRPGRAPMYVRRWPRTSASSRTPPSGTRTYLRPSDDAIDLPSEVLPTPGGPTSKRIGPCLLGASFRTARNSRMRRLTLSRPECSASRSARPGGGPVEPVVGEHVPRDLEQVLDVGPRDVVLGRRRRHLAHPRQLLLGN